MGTGQTYFAHFLQHLYVFFVKHILVEEERHATAAQFVPHTGGERLGDETSNHERAGFKSGDTLLDTDLADLLEEMHHTAVAE